MKHQRYWQYKEAPEDIWHPVSAAELLFVLLPTGRVFAYRCEIVITEEEKSRVTTEQD